MFNKTNIVRINPESLHGHISTINNSPFIEGNLREYLTLNLKTCEDNLEKLLDDLGVLDFMNVNKINLDSRIIPSGWPFLDNEKIILKVAKAILEDPKVIIITEIFDTVKYIDKKKILNYLINHTNATILCFANFRYDDIKFDNYLYIDSNSSSSFKNIGELISHEKKELNYGQ